MELKEIAETFKLPILIRYFYSGCLAIGILQLTPLQEATLSILKDLGTFLATLLVFFSGVFIWTFYHQVIGEIFMFPFVHWLHRKRWPGTSDIALLRECGVPQGQTRLAYSMVRAMYFPREAQDWVEINHAHNQLLDITWIEIMTLIVGFLIYKGVLIDAWGPLLAIAVVCFAASVYADIRQHSVERLLMLWKGKAELKKWLRNAHLIDSDPPSS